MINPFRIAYYCLWLAGQIWVGTRDVFTAIFRSGAFSTPMIVQLPLRCQTDLEITLMASSITITPGTLVVATAAATENYPATLFVHALFGESEENVIEDLRDMENRLLYMMRGRESQKSKRGTGVRS